MIDPGLPTVLGNRGRLLQMMQNLFDNALRFMGDQPQPRIETGHRAEGGDDVCYVRDNGIGVHLRRRRHAIR